MCGCPGAGVSRGDSRLGGLPPVLQPLPRQGLLPVPPLLGQGDLSHPSLFSPSLEPGVGRLAPSGAEGGPLRPLLGLETSPRSHGELPLRLCLNLPFL